MLCLLFSAALCQSNCIVQNGKDGAHITIIKTSEHGGSDRSSSIYASINGHTLSIAFTENFGDVSIKVLNESYVTIDLMTTPTPTGCQVYIPTSGRYILVITFPDGDEYSGDFEVSD